MRPLYFALFIISVCLTRQSGGYAQSPGVAMAHHPAAQALLDNNIKLFTRPEGIEVDYQQIVLGRSQNAVINGRSITADKRKVHIDLEYKQVGRTARLKLLCDGNTFYRLETLPEQSTMVSYTLQELQTALDQLATNETERVARDDVEKEQTGIHGFAGISAALSDLKKRMIFSEPKATTLEVPGKDKLNVNMIEGQWTNEVLDIIAPTKKGTSPNQQDQRYLWKEKLHFFQVPRLARLYFNASNDQLVRIEMVGITEKQGPDKVLVSIDLNKVELLKTLDAKLFEPNETEKKYTRIPHDLAADIKNRHQQTMNIMKIQQQMQSQRDR